MTQEVENKEVVVEEPTVEEEQEKDNVVIDIFKQLLEYNFTSYGKQGEILK